MVFIFFMQSCVDRKYTNSISHTKKISNLLDRINTAVLSNMPEDCVCCNSIDINSTDIITIKYQHFRYSININHDSSVIL